MAGNSLATDFSFDFFVLAGDANRSGVVDIDDLSILIANWKQSGRTFSQANFSYDAAGLVDELDLGALSANWMKTPDGTVITGAPMPSIAGITQPSAPPPQRPLIRPAMRPPIGVITRIDDSTVLRRIV
jgi:hypothetical protein